MTYRNDHNWKIPLNLAVAFHLLIMATAIYLPDLIDRKPLRPEVYTVDIVNLSEPVVENVEEPAPKAAPPKVPPPKAPPVEKAVSISKPAPAPEAPPAKAISIKPLKKKIKKKIVVDTAKKDAEKKRRAEQLKRQRQQLAEALREEQIAAEKARIAAEDAVKELKQMLRTTDPPKPRASNPVNRGTTTKRSSGGNKSALEGRYFAAIAARLQQYWVLPEYKTWDPSLSATIVVVVNKNGSIANQYFEKRSGDRMFDQFVLKTIEAAAPLPPIPPVLKINRQEFGFVFKPSGIQ